MYMYICDFLYINIHMNTVYIRYIICIHQLETAILVVSPGPGGMAKAKAHDTILYEIYTLVYISIDIYLYICICICLCICINF